MQDDGFRYIGKLPSIRCQRLIEKNIIREWTENFSIENGDFLALGIGDGEGLNFILEDKHIRSSLGKLIGIDINNKYYSQKSLLNIPFKKFEFICADIKKISSLIKKDSFDVIQGSFVFHDINYSEKNNVLQQVATAMKQKNSLFVFSDIFIDNKKEANRKEDVRRRKGIDKLYSSFINEAKECLKDSTMTEKEFNLLCGANNSEGLRKVIVGAKSGMRDFFEPINVSIERLENIGFKKMKVFKNPLNSYLCVITAQKGTVHV